MLQVLAEGATSPRRPWRTQLHRLATGPLAGPTRKGRGLCGQAANGEQAILEPASARGGQWGDRDATDVYEALTVGEIGAAEAAVKLSKAWPSAPAAAHSYGAKKLDATKRDIEAQLIMMEPDTTGHMSAPPDFLATFLDTYTAAGGDETTGTLVRDEIERWSKEFGISVPSITAMAETIELFAQ